MTFFAIAEGSFSLERNIQVPKATRPVSVCSHIVDFSCRSAFRIPLAVLVRFCPNFRILNIRNRKGCKGVVLIDLHGACSIIEKPLYDFGGIPRPVRRSRSLQGCRNISTDVLPVCAGCRGQTATTLEALPKCRDRCVARLVYELRCCSLEQKLAKSVLRLSGGDHHAFTIKQINIHDSYNTSKRQVWPDHWQSMVQEPRPDASRMIMHQSTGVEGITMMVGLRETRNAQKKIT